MNHTWNKYHERLLQKWAETSKTFSIMHSLCAQYYAVWHKRLGIPVVIIGGITASSIFSSSSINEEYLQWWTYLNGGLALIVTALSGVSNFISTQEKTLQHQNASFKYTKIALDIDSMLTFSRDERNLTPQEYINKKRAEILEIKENCFPILPWIMADYLNKFDKHITNTKSVISKRKNQSNLRDQSNLREIHEMNRIVNGDEDDKSTESSQKSSDSNNIISKIVEISENVIKKPIKEAEVKVIAEAKSEVDIESGCILERQISGNGLLNDFNDEISKKVATCNMTMRNQKCSIETESDSEPED
jgi:hypothetical protein